MKKTIGNLVRNLTLAGSLALAGCAASDGPKLSEPKKVEPKLSKPQMVIQSDEPYSPEWPKTGARGSHLEQKIDLLGKYESARVTARRVNFTPEGFTLGDASKPATDLSKPLQLPLGTYQLEIVVDGKHMLVPYTVSDRNGPGMQHVRVSIPPKQIPGFSFVSYQDKEGRDQQMYVQTNEVTFGQVRGYIEHVAGRVLEKYFNKCKVKTWARLPKAAQKHFVENFVKHEIYKRIPADDQGRAYFAIGQKNNNGYIVLRPNEEVLRANNLPTDLKTLNTTPMTGVSQGEARDYHEMKGQVFGVLSNIADYVKTNMPGWEMGLLSPKQYTVIGTDNGLILTKHPESLFGIQGLDNGKELLSREWEELGGRGDKSIRTAYWNRNTLVTAEEPQTFDHQNVPYQARLVIFKR